MIKRIEKLEKENVLMRDVYCNTLMNMAEKDPRIVVLDADLMNSMGTMPFLKKYPERTFDCGVQEANMIGVAAGLSATGKIPYAHTFGPFASRRCFDQVFISAAYAKLNVRIIGSDPGITAAFNGGTHMPFEDIGLMRTIPDITIIEPVDSIMLEDIIRQTKDQYGVFYIRLLRKNAIQIYEKDSTFEIGKGIILREGKDITIFCTGIMVSESLKAADLLEKEGISAKVVNIFTIKPIDEDLIIECAKQTGAIITAENHNVINGLGSAIAEVVVENYPVPIGRIGSQDLFGEVGPVDYLQKRFEMTAQDIANKAKEVITRK
ncbi:transketolase family protein [Garciella nitratireducens]|uniref:Transketolase n=1 Tax=Garciella nitratireducens DSM 15102 TaxID=1121911 RepID=A0A1T4LNC9_9FIRM|nr:transketolase family protein [Garciella nitratireducens]RBP46879.1 transketolase [Garciella nitratireducens]SJZ56193.1 transketolase [Garciella nitratireducens DSM 15102]